MPDEATDEILDEILQKAETLDASEAPEEGTPLPSSPPSSGGLDRFRVGKKDLKTKCRICMQWVLDIDKHQTSGTTNCSKLISEFGPEGLTPTAESAIESWFGAAICGAVLDAAEEWLTPEYKQMSEKWQDDTAQAIQTIAEDRLGLIAKNPYLVLLVSAAQFVMVNHRGIRRKYQNKELPNGTNGAEGAPPGPPAFGPGGDTRNRKDLDRAGNRPG